MSDHLEILVVGAGPIAREYIKVIKALGHEPIVVSRGPENLKIVNELYPDVNTYSGGLSNWLLKNSFILNAVIATPTEYLEQATRELLKAGCKNILVEKPLTFDEKVAVELSELAKKNKAIVHIAFNRRNYTSVSAAQRLIKFDGGVSSFHFDFSEATFLIDPNKYDKTSTDHWGIANSSHVIDTAFFLCGMPKSINANQYGRAINWHPAGSIFTGMGETTGNIPFTYHANWGAPGRWSISIMTPKRKLLFSPMEQLHQQVYGGFAITLEELDYSKDTSFKPGFYRQVESFITSSDTMNLLNIKDYRKKILVYNKIFGY